MPRPGTQIALVDLKRQYAGLGPDIDAAISSVLDSMQLFLGPKLRAFEEEYASYLGADQCIGVGDGTAALYLALRACGVGPGDEVITVSHTFFATVEAIAQVGARPVFVDIDPETMTMSVEAVERAITPRTRAIVPVHLYGRVADMPAIMFLARSHGLVVIEDACQAHGARLNGKAAGTFGDAGCFSFYYSKNLGAYGEAGCLVTNNQDVARNARALRDHGSTTRYHHDFLGVNSRLDEVQAAVLRVKLPHLDSWNEARRSHAARYNEVLSWLPVQLPTLAGEDHVFHLYVIRTPHRDELREYLALHGIGTGVHYPVPCHRQPACAAFGSADLPATEAVVDEILSLPMFPELRADEIDHIAGVMREFFLQQRARKAAGMAYV